MSTLVSKKEHVDLLEDPLKKHVVDLLEDPLKEPTEPL